MNFKLAQTLICRQKCDNCGTHWLWIVIDLMGWEQDLSIWVPLKEAALLLEIMYFRYAALWSKKVRQTIRKVDRVYLLGWNGFDWSNQLMLIIDSVVASRKATGDFGFVAEWINYNIYCIIHLAQQYSWSIWDRRGWHWFRHKLIESAGDPSLWLDNESAINLVYKRRAFELDGRSKILDHFRD